jgi:pimeloyl-ACP methyl ester carboxylesterase
MPFLTINHNKFYYKITGSGAPVVFISGLAAQHQSWGLQFIYLKKWFRLISIDNRGTGKSNFEITHLSIDDMVLDIDALLNAIDVDKVHLVGFSMGGMVALEYASKNPARVSSLILSSLPIEQPREIFESLAEDLSTAFLQNKNTNAVFNMLSSYLFSYDFLKRRQFEIMEDWVNKNPVEHKKETTLLQLDAIGKWLALRRWEKGCNCPCLMIFGSNDRLIPLGTAIEGVLKNFPHAESKIIEGSGHAIHIEKADEFNKIIFDFLMSQSN